MAGSGAVLGRRGVGFGPAISLLVGLSFFGASGHLHAQNSPPSAVSVTPSSGGGPAQMFTLLYSDPNGATDISTVYMLANSSLSAVNACYTLVNRASSVVYLRKNDDSGWLGPVAVGSGSTTVENSQCRINAPSSSIVPSGNNLTVNLSITFKSAFAGGKTVYMQAMDNGGLWTGWQSRGSWTVTNQGPSAVSVTPAVGAGSSQMFSFLYSDANGATDINAVYMLANSSLSAANACYTLVNRASSVVYLRKNDDSGWLGPVAVGSGSTTVENSQCRVNAPTSSITTSLDNLTVSLSLTFKPAFAGVKQVYMQSTDNGGLWSGWQDRGDWTVSGPTITTASPLPAGTVGVAYSQTLAAAGGTPPYTWAVSAGALPSGLTLNPSTGVLSGIPTAPGTSNFTVQVTDTFLFSATKPFAVTVVSPPLTITTASPLPNGTVGTAYSQTLAATGGTPPYTWAVSVGALPSGLTLNASTGVLSGTPTAASTSNFTVQVSGGGTATKNFSLTIETPGPSSLTWDIVSGGGKAPNQSFTTCGRPNCVWVGSDVFYVSPGQAYGRSTTYSTGPDSWNTVNYTSARMQRDGADMGSYCASETTSSGVNEATARVPCNTGVHFYVYATSFYVVRGQHHASNTLWNPNDSGTVQTHASLGFVAAGATARLTIPQDGFSDTSLATGPTISPNDGTSASYVTRAPARYRST